MEDIKEVQEKRLKRRQKHITRLVTTSPQLKPDDNFPEENTCSISLEEQTHLQITSIDGFFNRKRGRPPKNRFVELYKDILFDFEHRYGEIKPNELFNNWAKYKNFVDEIANEAGGQNLEDLTDWATDVVPFLRLLKLHPLTAAGRDTKRAKLHKSVDSFITFEETHPKPQAIFTSFKLEKYESKNTVTPQNAANIYLCTDIQTLRDCEIDVNKSSNYSRQQPVIKNSTQRKRTYHKMNNCSPSNSIANSETLHTTIREASVPEAHSDIDTNTNSENITHDIKKNRPLSTYWTKPLPSEALEVRKCATQESITGNSSSTRYNQTLCGTTRNVTVVRAAGTFYPKNSIDNTKFTDLILEKLQDGPNHKIKAFSFAKEVQHRETSNGNAVPEDKEIYSSAKTLSSSNFFLPQIFNVLQMQQQFLAFFQQMALMAPLFSYLDTKRLANVTEPYTNLIDQYKEQQKYHTNQEQKINKSESDQWLAENPKFHTSTEMLTMSNIGTSKTKDTTATSSKIQPSSRVIQEGIFRDSRERAPTGYIRFRSKEDCGYDKCGYRQHQSHFHCNRSDCQYSFCDKTRFVQHTARHDRLDNLMGCDFQQYSAKTSCNIDCCPYNSGNGFSEVLNARKSSHFHCLKCRFVNADSNKIVAHRRFHSKMEFIRSAGFRKVSSNENCTNTNFKFQLTKTPTSIATADISKPTIYQFHQCAYSMRHSHYHCLTCNASVLSRSHLISHKHRSPDISISTSLADASPSTETSSIT